MRDKPVIFAISQDDATLSVVSSSCAVGEMVLLKTADPNRIITQAKLAEPDVIILDEAYKDAHWLDLYKGLCAELSFTFVPVLVLVDAAHTETAMDQMESGLVDLLEKPVSHALLRARIKAMLLIKEIHDDLDQERNLLQQKLDDERRLREQLAAANEELKKLSTTDGLTGLSNYRYLKSWLSTEFEIASRYGMPLSAIMIDLDNFKNVNDKHGHLFGDFVLTKIAEIVLEQSRRADFSARYGGEEFAVVLPNTDGHAASNLAHRIHHAIEKKVFKKDKISATVTASIGISTFPADGVNSAETLIDVADRALYAAKSRGRNMVVSWSEVD